MKSALKVVLTVLTSILAISILTVPSFGLDDKVVGGRVCDQSRVIELKSQIVSIATSNQTRRDNIDQVQAQLQPLLSELIALVPYRTETDKAYQVAGGWYNLWSNSRFGPFVDYAQVYQVVDKDGFYYNISKNVAPFGTFTNYLRGAFSDAGDYLRIEFTRSITVNGWLNSGLNLSELSDAVESGAIDGPDEPRGPIGVQGDLRNAFVDDQLRIVIGRSDGDAFDSIFILIRSDVVR